MSNVYYSFSAQEMGIILSGASGDEGLLYMALKKFADFKTGLMKHHITKRLNFSFLADMLSRDSRQGCEAKVFTHVEIRRLLTRLVALGLVDDMERDGRTLSLRLPLVGGEYGNGKDAAGRLSGKTTEEKPKLTGSHPEMKGTGNPVTARVSAAIGNDGKVRLSGPPDNPDERLSGEKTGELSGTLAGQGVATSPARSFSTSTKPSVQPPLLREGKTSPPAVENQTPKTHHDPSGLIRKTEIPETDSSGNGFMELVEREGEGLIRFHASEISRKIYRSWERCKFDRRDVGEAIRKVLGTQWLSPTPNSIDAVLREAFRPQKVAPKRNGSLCL